MIDPLLTAAARGQRRLIAAARALAVIGAISGVALLGISGWFLVATGLAGIGGITAAQAFNYLLPSAAIRGLAITRTGARYGERLLGHQAALLTLARLRPALFARIAAQEPVAALARAPGAVATQLGADVDALEDRVIRQVTGFAAVAAALAGLSGATLAGWPAAGALLCGLVASQVLWRSASPRLLARAWHDQAQALAALRTAYAAYAPNAAEIAVYGLGDRISAMLAPLGRALDAARERTVWAEAVIMAGHGAISAITVAAVLLLARGGAALTALSALAALVALEVWGALGQSAAQQQRVAAALARLDNIAKADPRALGGTLPANRGSLSFDGHGQSRSISVGERVLIAGPSGSGKTRLIETLIGLRSDAPEQLTVDGIMAQQVGLDALRARFAWQPQNELPLAGTIADNLSLARPGIDEAEMHVALTVACLDIFVATLPDGLATWLDGEHARLSGGQRKRLALARALLARRPWLVLDEPTEGLDPATEAEVVRRLDQWLSRTRTGLVLVSHRPAPRALADRRFSLAN